MLLCDLVDPKQKWVPGSPVLATSLCLVMVRDAGVSHYAAVFGAPRETEVWRIKDGLSWRIGRGAEIAWIQPALSPDRLRVPGFRFGGWPIRSGLVRCVDCRPCGRIFVNASSRLAREPNSHEPPIPPTPDGDQHLDLWFVGLSAHHSHGSSAAND